MHGKTCLIPILNMKNKCFKGKPGKTEATQRAYNVKNDVMLTCDVITSHRRQYDIILAPNAHWELTAVLLLNILHFTQIFTFLHHSIRKKELLSKEMQLTRFPFLIPDPRPSWTVKQMICGRTTSSCSRT